MYALRVHDPALPLASSVPPEEVLRQAAADASAVPGAYATAPWAFRTPTEAAEGLLDDAFAEAFDGIPGGWIVVTCRGACDEGEGGHLRERTLTAVQRFMLSLAADDLEAVWTDDGFPEGLEEAMPLGPRETILGLVRWHAV